MQRALRWTGEIPVLPALTAVLLVAGHLASGSAAQPVRSVNPGAIVIVPFDAAGLASVDQWMGEAVAQATSLGLAQQAGLVQIERDRFSRVVNPAVWTEGDVRQAGQSVRADAALYGSISRQDSDLLLQPRLVDLKSGRTSSLPSTTFPEAELSTRLASLAVLYARALLPGLTDAASSRIQKAAQITGSVRALELFSRGQTAINDGEHERAVDLLTRATEADPTLAMASVSLGHVHAALGNRWKAAAMFRAACLIDASMPEPFKALGDLFLSTPRNLFDQAIDGYSKAIELRPHYADAYAGLGNAYAAKGDIDRAISAYRTAIALDPFQPTTHVRLGHSYARKGQCADAVKAYRQAGELDRFSMVVQEPCGARSP